MSVISQNGKVSVQQLFELLQGNKKPVIAETEFSTTTDKIIIPEGMTLLEASEELERRWEDEETEVDVSKTFNEWDWKDVLHSIKVITEETFGWISTRPGWFNPKYIQVETNIVNGKSVQSECFYGEFKIAVWEGANADININRKGEASIQITLKKRYKEKAAMFISAIEENLKHRSIYMGRAVSVEIKETMFGKFTSYQIMELIPGNIFLNEDAQGVIDNLIVPELSEQSKRSYLFVGSYGNGKSETAISVGKEATAKGLTFFYVKEPSSFTDVLRLAKNYKNGAVVFLEDVDTQAGGEERNDQINNLLNTLDGAETKGHKLKVIFTTNHPEKINPAFLRPGRTDVVVLFENPLPSTAVKIVQSYLTKFDTSSINWSRVAELMPDVSGAVCAEIGKRSQKMCQDNVVSEKIIAAAIDSMKFQVSLMSKKMEEKEPVLKSLENIAEAMGLI